MEKNKIPEPTSLDSTKSVEEKEESIKINESREKPQKTMTINGIIIPLTNLSEGDQRMGIDLSIREEPALYKGSLKPGVMLSMNFRKEEGDSDFDTINIIGWTIRQVEEQSDYFAEKYCLDKKQAKLLKDEMVGSFLNANPNY